MRRSLVGVLCDGLASSDLVRLRLTDFTVYGIVVGPPTWRRLCTPVMVVVDRGERGFVWGGRSRPSCSSEPTKAQNEVLKSTVQPAAGGPGGGYR